MRLKPKSLQGRLLFGILASLTVTLALGGVVIYRVVDSHLREEFDSALEEKLRFYETTFSLREGMPKWNMGTAEWKRVSDPANPDYVQFWFLPQGKFFFRSPGLQGTDLPRAPVQDGGYFFSDILLFGKTPARLVSREFVPNQIGVDEPVKVQIAIARHTGQLQAALDQVRWFLIKTAFCTTLVLMGATRWIVRRGVRPVSALAGQIEAMPLVDSDLRFGLPGAPTEIQPVVGRLNALMDRVGAAIEHERMFTSNAAHELRNPLAAIRSRVELALSRTRSVEEYEETLDGILESQNGMQRVVDHLLLLARLESGHQVSEFSQEAVSLSKLLRKAWRPTFDRASERRLKVVWQVEEPASDIIIPVALIEIVLRNLFDNAAAYTPEGGQIIIRAEARGNQARISVSNTNPGLTEQILESTFSPFWRGDPNASGHRGNAGIGLALVRRIMETMEGKASATLAEGMVVYTLHFPVRPVTDPSPVPPVQGPAPSPPSSSPGSVSRADAAPARTAAPNAERVS
ncbi:MAG: cusS [Verrucomicrobiales bacterium]|nr:cusS [Verrucomicrobiales bacterium]